MSYIIGKGGCDEADYVDFINYAFGMNGTSSSFYRLLPKLFGEGKKPSENTFFATENGRIAGCVGAFPLEFSIDGKKLTLCAIGNVATHPRARGKGLMKKLMNEATRDMCENDIDLGVLGGRRHRYNFFGYEKCDCLLYFSLTPKTVGYVLPDFKPKLEMKRLTADDGEILDPLCALMNARAYRAERTRETLYETLISWKSVPYVFFDKARIAGWAISYGSKEQISEFYACDAADAQDMAAQLVGKLGEIQIALPPFDTDTAREILKLSENCTAVSDENFCVFNWRRVLDALMTFTAARKKLCDGSLSVKIDGIKASESLTVSVKDGKVTVTEAESEPHITLTGLEAEKLFFMTYAPERDALPPDVRSWFPLPLYISAPDNC